MEALRVVIGAGADGVAAFDAAVARGGTVLAVAPPGSVLAAHAGARNVEGEAVASVVIFADEVVDVDAAPAP